MNYGNWQEARNLLEVAFQHGPEEWDGVLNRACIDNPALRQEVDALLEAHLAAGRFLGGPAEEQKPLEGRRIGAYEVVRRVGRGGMGEVYLAVRADDEFQKRVALKLLKPGMETEEVNRRFRTERQILAALDHPNIARLLDGGTTPEGLPYIVMEYVEGRPIDRYCDDHGYSIRQRLDLFCVVCSAVQYAHRNLVVHRDLKPSNILVTSEGIPKLLDFGVAKLLNPELSSLKLAPTATVMRLMTPEYASPEQARGEPVTTAADVYSLGVLLYQLLSSHRPYRIDSPSPVEILRVICEHEPEPPSLVVMQDRTAAKLRRRLAGDLDNIVLKALRKEPARRYGSAEHFAEDLRRHLDGRPVLARKDSLTYRLGKFVRRHRLGVAIAGTFMAACLGFGLIMAMQRAQIADERDRASEERFRAERVTRFLIDVFEISDPYKEPGKPVHVEQILAEGARRLETELQEEPETRSRLLATIAQIYLKLGEFSKAQTYYRKALQISSESDHDHSLLTAEILDGLATDLQRQGSYDKAEQLFRQALSIRRSLLGSEHPDVGRNLTSLAHLLWRQRDFDAAMTVAQDAVEMWRSLREPAPLVADSLDILAMIHGSLGDYELAETLLREALAIRQESLGREHLSVAETMAHLAALLKDSGRYEEAEELYRKALAIRRQNLDDDHPEVGVVLNCLANLLERVGNYSEATTLLTEAVAILRRRFGNEHPNVAGGLGNLAAVLRHSGDLDTSETLLLEALEICRKRPLEEEVNTAHILTALAKTLVAMGRFAEAETRIREAIDIFDRTLSSGNWKKLVAETVLGRCLAGLGRHEIAEPLLQQAYLELRNIRGPGSPETLEAVEALVNLYEITDRQNRANEYRALLLENGVSE